MKISLLLGGVLVSAFSVCGQTPPAPVSELRGLPPRPVSSEYQGEAKAGAITIAAEFLGHGIPTQNGATYTSDTHVAVEVAVYGAKDARGVLSMADFALRINGKVLPSQPDVLVMKSLKDPEWEMAAPAVPKAKSNGVNSGGGGGEPEAPVVAPKMEPALRRAMEKRVQQTAFPEGDRPLPQAGIIFFQYGGKIQNIRTVELLYTGSAGKATVTLHP